MGSKQYKYAIVGDVHGCIVEFRELLDYLRDTAETIVSVGDLTDKGPDSNGCCELAAERGVILVNSNHDDKYIQYIKKNRAANTVKSDSRRKIYESLSSKSKEYLVTAKPYFRGEFKTDQEPINQFIVVHGGVGPNHHLFPIDGKTYNEILRLRYVDKDTLEKVSTIHNADGTWGPEHLNVHKWQEVYHGQYGPVFHGHIVEKLGEPVYWVNGQRYEHKIMPVRLHLTHESTVISIDTGCVYGGTLTAALVDKYGYVTFYSVKAKKVYDTRNQNQE